MPYITPFLSLRYSSRCLFLMFDMHVIIILSLLTRDEDGSRIILRLLHHCCFLTRQYFVRTWMYGVGLILKFKLIDQPSSRMAFNEINWMWLP